MAAVVLAATTSESPYLVFTVLQINFDVDLVLARIVYKCFFSGPSALYRHVMVAIEVQTVVNGALAFFNATYLYSVNF